MTYIYDILLNFNEEYYEFYDWNKEDIIVHIKKIPIYKITEKDLKNIVYGNVVFDNNFLEIIKDKTEIFSKHERNNMKYSCLLCSSEKVLAVTLNENGKVLSKSDLLIDEYNEILNIIDECNYMNINYIIEKKDEINEFKTRKTKEREKFIKRELEKFNDNELKYIYYEFFFENEKSRKKILSKLKQIDNQECLYKIVKIIAGKYKKIK